MNNETVNTQEIIKSFERCTNSHGSCNTCMYCFIKHGEMRCDAKKRNRDIINIIYNLQNEIESIRKETAKEIFQCLYDKCYEIQNMGRGGIAHILPIDILQLAEKYGVEVEE